MFSNILKKTRKELGLTQANLAKMIGLDTSSIAKYETGNAKPSLEIALKIADALRISLDTLLGREPDAAMKESGMLAGLYAHAPSYLKKIAVLSLSQGTRESLLGETPPYSIDYYINYPVPAGWGKTPKEVLFLKKAPPEGACFVSRITGDSMKPNYQDGDMIFVSPDPAEIGQIGICIYDNAVYIKKLGDHELISLNHAYSPVRITKPDTFFCVGTVLGKCDDSYLG